MNKYHASIGELYNFPDVTITYDPCIIYNSTVWILSFVYSFCLPYIYAHNTHVRTSSVVVTLNFRSSNVYC